MTAWVIGLIVIAIVWAVLAHKIRELRLDNLKAYRDHEEAFSDDSNDIISETMDFDQEVVGESHYQSELADIAARLIDGSRFVQATLCLEDDNEHDKNAVAVKISGLAIGYLPRDAARKYRKIARKRGLPGESKCPAMIAGGTEGKYYGVWLGIDELD